MTRGHFSRAAAERRLGPAVVAAVRASVDSAPPLRPELREQIRTLLTPLTPEASAKAA